MPFKAADDSAQQVMGWAKAFDSEGMVVQRDVAYGPHRLHRYNVFSPLRAVDAPVMIFWHGGGWTNGYRDYNSFMDQHIAALGSVLVVVFAVLRSGGSSAAGISFADLLLLAAMLCAAVGYCYGGRLAGHMRAEHVICWALVISLPITLPLSIYAWPTQAIRSTAWWGFAYVAVFSMWLGFFAWYRGLALGGTVRVSQVQLVQPFLSMLFSIPLLGEKLDAVTVGFGLAVIATVFMGKKMPVGSSN